MRTHAYLILFFIEYKKKQRSTSNISHHLFEDNSGNFKLNKKKTKNKEKKMCFSRHKNLSS